MAIPALRFKALDLETNVGIANFSDIKTSDIFTSPNNLLTSVTDGLKSMLENVKQAIEVPKSAIAQISDTLTRATQDIFSAVKDLTGLTPKKIEGMIASLLPNNSVIQNAFNKLASQCRNNTLSKVNPLKFKDKFGCGSKKGGKCDSFEVNGMLNKLTNGLLGNLTKKIGDSINALLVLAGMGYDVGLCKVFQVLSESLGIDKNNAGRAAGVLLGQLASSGNTRGLIDLASSTAGLAPLLSIPGAIGNAVEKYAFSAVGGAIGMAAQASDLFTRFDAGMEILQDGWKISAADDLPSLANMGSSWNADFGTGLTLATTGRWPSIEDLSSPEGTDSGEDELEALAAAYSSYDPPSEEDDAFLDLFKEATPIEAPTPIREDDTRSDTFEFDMAG